MNTVDVRKMLGNPKITFVLGRDSEYRAAVCDKLVEEFKYKYISTEQLIQIENQKSKKKISDGGMGNYEAIVALLVNSLIANPSKNYLIDGFPTTSEQAIYFEQNVCECQTILYFDEPTDDNDEHKEESQSKNPIINEVIYKYNKVKFIDSTQDMEDVYIDTKRALLPEVFFIIGPKAAGKTTVGTQLAHRTNMKLLDFEQFVKCKNLCGQDDESIVFELIKDLVDEVSPRVIIENFPQNDIQARCFMANCTNPARVFYCRCSKDICQERMITLGKSHPGYVSSAILSKKIKKFHDQSPTLIPLLQERTQFHEIDCDQEVKKVQDQINSIIEPTIIHIRAGTNNDLKKEMIQKLVSDHGFINLEVNSLIRMETERRTAVGQEFFQTVSAGKIIPADMVVRMLRKIIYSGQNYTKFILNGFPDIIEHVNEFEKNCAKLSAIFLTTTQNENVVDVKNNNLTLFNIDALFQKEFRLKITDSWDYNRFSEMLGHKTDYIIVTGTWCSGKTTLCQYLQSSFGYQVINHLEALEECKKRHENDEEPPERIPAEEVLEELRNKIAFLKQTSTKFVFDTLPGTEPEHFEAIFEFMGTPDYIFNIDCDLDIRKKRFLARAEAEEWTDEHEEEVKGLPNNTPQLVEYAGSRFEGVSADRFRLLEFNLSDDSMKKQINDELSPKVILISHDKRLASDTT